MKKALTSLMIVTILMTSNVSMCQQWQNVLPAGNISNTNTGSVVLNGTLDQRNLNPSGVPLEPGGTTAQVNANFGGLILHSTSNTSAVMNMFWGQNFDYHNNNDIRYRIMDQLYCNNLLMGICIFILELMVQVVPKSPTSHSGLKLVLLTMEALQLEMLTQLQILLHQELY